MKRFVAVFMSVVVTISALAGCSQLHQSVAGLVKKAVSETTEVASSLQTLSSEAAAAASKASSAASKTGGAVSAKKSSASSHSVSTVNTKKEIVIRKGSTGISSKSGNSSTVTNKPIIPVVSTSTPASSAVLVSSSSTPASSVASASAYSVSSSYNIYEYGRTLLSSSEAACYDALVNGIAGLKTTFRLPYSLSYDDFSKIVSYYLDDHPEVFYIAEDIKDSGEIDLGIGYDSTFRLVYMQYQYSDSTIASMQEQMYGRVETLLSGVTAGMTDYQKEKVIHDAFITSIKYDLTAAETPSQRPQSFDAYGALVGRTAVCEGYAKAIKILYDAAGLKSLYVTGIGIVKDSSGQTEYGAHAFNMVELDGTWYWVDATFDDPVYSYTDNYDSGHEVDTYLDCTTAFFTKNHIYYLYGVTDPYTDEDIENYTSLPAAA